jgi:transcriptional regulator with XRE-family HTH domain
MPHVDEAAKAWELELAGRVGAAVAARRKALKLTAQQLAERTKELGYPITRVAISKIEGNMRAGKLDVAELVVLAVALEIPPALLLIPGFPDGDVELLPGRGADSVEAMKWMSGEGQLPVIEGTSNMGVVLVAAVGERAELDKKLSELQLEKRDKNAPVESIKRTIAEYRKYLVVVNTEIDTSKNQLWSADVSLWPRQ